MNARFTVDGEPVGKGRPRFSRAANGRTITRTPEATVAYEQLVVCEHKKQCGSSRFDDEDRICIKVVAYFAIPTTASKNKRRDMENGIIRPAKKPDADNILKIVCDALNTVAYKDDTQIVDAIVTKYYSDHPRVEVIMQTAR